MSAVVREFRRLAIFDRGVGALRLVNAARELRREAALDLTIVAVHQNGDATAPFVREADETLSFGAATFVDDRDGRRKSSYLDESRVEQALLAVRADAVAAGAASVAVQAALSRLCSRLGVLFVGPEPAPLELLADEIAVKRFAAELQLQVAPWSGRAVATHAEAMWHAEQLGFPLRIRSAAGSGGAVGRTVRRTGEVIAVFEDVRAQAIAALGDGTVLFEQGGTGARRCAVQVLVDQYGTCWVAGMIDRTLRLGQRPIITESPPPGLSPALAGALRENAVRLATASGFRGAASFEFRCDLSSSTSAFSAADPRLADEHTVLEACTGLDLVKLQLRLARGGRLAAALPAPRGHALSVRLAAEDAENQLAAAPGMLELLQLPSGAGVFVDGGVAAGEIIPRDDPTIARVTACGHDRLEALARLERALRDCTMVVRGSATNKGVLVDLLEQPELRHGQPDDGWLDRRASRDAASALRYADVALLSAAIDAYDADFAVERTMFLASAARGRPRVKHDVGVDVALRLRGQAYRFAVARVGPRDYRITADGASQRVCVDRAGEFESRLHLDGKCFRILSVGHGLERLVEVDGVPHRVSHDAGGIVRAPGPAVVLAILVKAGDSVAAGDRLVILEAMKMEMPVLAPFAGRVREILVAPNVQVDVGAALLVVEPPAAGAPASSARVSFAAADERGSGAGGNERSGWTAAYDEARRLMLGFDVDRAAATGLAARWPTLQTELHADLELLRAEVELLDAFTTIHALFRPQRDPDDLGGHEAHAVQEYLLSYLRAPDAQGEGLPPSFLAKLERALALHGVIGLRRSRALEDALVHIYRARERAEEQAELVLGILSRLLERHAELAGALGSDFQALLHRLIAVSHARFPIIGDLAREVRHRAFDEPLFTRAREEVYAAAEGTLARLLVEREPDVRRRLLQDLVECPQPLVGLLTRRLESVPSASRDLMLEVLTRRYYRMRHLENLRFQGDAAQTCALSEYELDGRRLALLTTFATYAELADTLRWTCAAIAALPSSHDVILDLFVRRAAPLGDAAATAAELRALVEQAPWPRPLRRIVFAIAGEGGGVGMGSMQHFTYRPTASGSGYMEDPLYRGLHPMMGKRMQVWRLANFAIERLPSVEDVYLFRGVAHTNPKDERLLALAEVRDLTPVRDAHGRVVQLPHLERMLVEALAAIRQQQVRRPPRARLLWNRVLLYVWPPLDLGRAELDDLVRRLAPITEGLGLEQVMVCARVPDPASGALVDSVLRIASLGPQGGLDVTWDEPPTEPLRPLGPYEQKVLALRRRGLAYPYEIVRSLTAPPDHAQPGLPPGDFVEYDLDEEGRLVPVARPHGENTAHLVVGLIRNHTVKYPEGMQRVILLGDPSKEMGSVAEPECRRITEALALARRLQVPVEWFTLSAGAKISMDSGTENMDWIARVLRHLIEFTQDGHEVNVLVIGINVGAQPYWNAEATMLMHTRGILVMTPESAMVLTGKQALDYSGSVSAEDNQGIGGYERVMGQNGQAQYWAADLAEACRILLRHYDHTYVAPGEGVPRRAATTDPADRDVRSSPHAAAGETGFVTVGDVVSEEHNRGRKQPFEIRRVMAAVIDRDHPPLERWPDMRDAEIAVVWDAHLGGYPVCLIGMESHPLQRLGFVPADGPTQWTAGTLFPRSSKKIARTINAASGNRPIVVLANLSGFDGSPESMRNLQLEYGAEIGRAVVNFRGPIVFCVVSRYHGGAFVVFSKALNESFEAAALEGAYASVIGGAPAAAVVFARDVDERTRTDARVHTLEREIASAAPDEQATLRARLAATLKAVHSERLGEVADEFDHVHTVQRALRVGSLDHIVPPARLRPYLIEALERGLRRSVDVR